MDYFTSLPDDVIEHILENLNITFSDVNRLSCTCTHVYRAITSNNKLWKTKFFQRWPNLKEVYAERNKFGASAICWKTEIQTSLISRCNLLDVLSSMSKKHYEKTGLTSFELKEIDPLFRPELGAHPFAYHFLIDELTSLLQSPAMFSNLTRRYYAYNVIRYLKQQYLTKEWKRFTNLPEKQQTLERGATFVVQWNEPTRYISYSYISRQLDEIANQTKELLREQHPSHSIFSWPSEVLETWKHNIIDDNQWSISETRQVMDAICNILFNRLGFHGNREMHYSLENSFIDRVLELKRGIPITLAVIFESIARRLGVRCEAVSFPSHFLLRWKEKYNTSEGVETFYIDVLNGGQLLTKRNCPRVGGVSKCPIEKYNVHTAATATEVVTRMANNLHTSTPSQLRSILELQHMVQPYNIDVISQMGDFYCRHRINVAEIIYILNNLESDIERSWERTVTPLFRKLYTHHTVAHAHKRKLGDEVEPKLRSPEIIYAIGLIMKHKTYNYLCVIAGWDTQYETSTQWIVGRDYTEIDDGCDQPYYKVFVDDGSARYLAQGSLLLASNPEWVNNFAIGRNFYKFAGTHYIPNEETSKEYPEDEEVRNKLIGIY